MSLRTVATFLLIAIAVSCIAFVILQKTTSKSLPNQSNDLREFLIDETAFPEGWRVELQLEQSRHPLSNHIHREFFLVPPSEDPAGASQDVWRANTIDTAQDKYEELLESQYQPSRPLNPGQLFVAFEHPSDIHLPTGLADESYLACGWWIWAYCQLVSRYQNYVVYLRLDQKAEFEGHITNGLTSQEIEAVIWAMDSKFAEVLDKSSQVP